MHVGLIQVVAKPLYRLGIDTLILIILRDIRAITFKGSILACLQLNLYNGLSLFQLFSKFHCKFK